MPGRDPIRRFGPAELELFLAAVDTHLEEPAEVVLVGGGAAAVGYGVDTGTHDLDAFNPFTGPLADAVQQARRDTGLAIPFGQAGVVDAPYNYEGRLRRAMPQLQRLTVRVLEKHDLALSKVIRGYEHDMEQIESLHQHDPLDRDILVERFLHEMGHAIGRPRMIALAFLECIERLFGELARSRAEQQLRAAGRLHLRP